MTPQQIEALKLALEALEGFYEYGYDRQECFEHITAIKEALAEHAMRETQRLGQEIEQEPLAITNEMAFAFHGALTDGAIGEGEVEEIKTGLAAAFAHITTPPQRTEQEPVAWVCEGSASDEKHDIDYWQEDIDAIPIGTQLYTTPPQRTWVELTDAEIDEESSDYYEPGYEYGFRKGALWAEAKLKEKNQ